MWQRFSANARKAVFYAQEEAQRFGEGYVSTEHLLLGICCLETTAAVVLGKIGISRNRLRAEVERQLPRSDVSRPSQDMTLAPRAKRVIDLANDEAVSLNHGYIGTEHLLLGLIREGDGLAGRVLAKLGAELAMARSIVQELPVPDDRKNLPPLTHGTPTPKLKGIQVTAGVFSVLEPRFGLDFLALIVLSKPTPAVEEVLDRLGIAATALQAALENEFLQPVNSLLKPELPVEDGHHPLDFLRLAALSKPSFTRRALKALGKSDEEIESAFSESN